MQGWELAVKQYNFYWGICIVWMQQILGTVTFTISHHFTYSALFTLSSSISILRGSIFNSDGKLVASCVQEGLMRMWDKPKS